MTSDAELLRRYVREDCESAFAELVQRHVGFVYGAALRELGGATHRAEDVTQAVFIALARKSKGLLGRSELAGWLHTCTHFSAAKLKRAEQRREAREFAAHAMHEANSAPSADWDQLRPVIDEVLQELSEKDREAILMRFFQGRRLAEVARYLGTKEDAARMRVERALDRMKTLLARRNITSSSIALSALLANQPVVAVPGGFCAALTHRALTSAASASTSSLLSMSKLSLLTTTAAGLILAFGTYEFVHARAALAASDALKGERDNLVKSVDALTRQLAESERKIQSLEERASANVATSSYSRTVSSAAAAATTPAASRVATRGPSRSNPDAGYTALYRQLGLRPEQIEQFKTIVSEGNFRANRLFNAAMEAAVQLNPNPDRATILDIAEAARGQALQEQRAGLQAALGEHVAEAFVRFEETRPFRSIAWQLAIQLLNTEAPLAGQQVEHVIAVLAQHSTAQNGTKDVAALDVDGALRDLETRGVLTALQLAELRGLAASARDQAAAQRK